MGHYANDCKSGEGSSGNDTHVTFAMICYEDGKYVKGEEENIQDSTNPEEEERRVDHGTACTIEELQGDPHLQSCVREVFKTGITNE